MSENTSQAQGKCHVCNCTHAALGLRRDEMNFPTTLVGTHEVHKACAHELEYLESQRSNLVIDGLGVCRWASNGAVVPLDAQKMLCLPADAIARAVKAIEIETRETIEAYRKSREQAMKDPAYRAEYLHELRAAHGIGVTIVDALTGETYHL